MAHFAFVDSLWFGEGFSSEYPADQWLVEMSGIPFGLHAEQLAHPNLWRGMVFAEGQRPAPALWKAWDALQLTLDGTHLVGWWDSAVPVTTNNTAVLASVYLRPSGKGFVVALASWASTDVNVELNIDWQSLGLDENASVISAPAIDGFQPEATFSPTSPILNVDVGKGWLVSVTSEKLYV